MNAFPPDSPTTPRTLAAFGLDGSGTIQIEASAEPGSMGTLKGDRPSDLSDDGFLIVMEEIV